MIYTKPCTRPTCDGICTALTPSAHRRRRFCSLRCAALARYEAGAKPPTMPHSVRVAAGRAGGLKAGIARRKRAIEAVAEEVGKLVPLSLRQELARAGVQRWQVVLAKAVQAGRAMERNRLRMAKAS
jgi:hypothetical protein